MSQHKTYDTDIITLRRIFAASPGSNLPVQSDYILTTGEYGEARFINPLTISSITMSEDSSILSEEKPVEEDRLRGVAIGVVGLYTWFYPLGRQ